MKKTRAAILCLAVFLLTAPLLRAQDYSHYRGFALGANLATVLKQTAQKLADVTVPHGGSGLFQELNWRPPNLPGPGFRADRVGQILFSFYNGALYKMSVTYDRASTEGLKADDMVKSISAKYGPLTTLAPTVDPAALDTYDAKDILVASWEGAQYSLHLVHSAFTDGYGLVLYSKRASAEAELALAESLQLEKLEGSKREAARQKEESDDAVAARLKNQKTFRP